MKWMLRFTVISLFVLLGTQILCATEVNLTNEGNAAGQFYWGKKINVQIKDMLLPDALAILLKDTGIACKVDPDVAMLRVTADFRDISLQKALTELGRVSNTVITLTSDSISTAEDSWITGPHTTVSVKKRLNPSPSTSLGTESVSAQVASQDSTMTKDAHAIPLKYYTPVDMLRLLEVINWVDFLTGNTSEWTKKTYGPLPNTLPKEITSISLRPNSKALFVTGEEAAVAELTQIISKIDVEPKQTRQINIHITRYPLGSVIPESFGLLKLGSMNGVTKIGWATKSQLDALTSELLGKGIEPLVNANIATLDSFPVAVKVFGGGTVSSTMPARSINLQVTPRLNPADNSITMTIIPMQSTAVEESGQMVWTCSSMTCTARFNLGDHAVIFEPSDSTGGGSLTIITATL